MTERITLQPGDAVRLPLDDETYNAVGEAFLAAGAEVGEFQRSSVWWDRRLDYFGWKEGLGLLHGHNPIDAPWVHRIIEPEQILNATNAGNNNQEQEMTPAQKAGWEIGDRGIVVDGNGILDEGSIVEFYRDDRTMIPIFKLISGTCKPLKNAVERGCTSVPGHVTTHVALDRVRKTDPRANILREIADVLDAGGEPVREFEFRDQELGKWWSPDSLNTLVWCALSPDHEIRRKPKTVRASGEVSHEAIDSATHIVGAEIGGNAETVARALLSLVENES